MALQITLLIAGLLLILFGANWLVDGSSSVAKQFGISEFVIGLTIVGIGTSTPEMVVSFLSSFQGKADMAIGNIVGSNIFNTLMILGITALVAPVTITKTNLKKDIPMNILVTILLIVLGMNFTLFGAGKDQICSAAALEGNLFFQFVCRPGIVAVQKGQPLAPGLGHSVVTGLGCAAVAFITQQPYPRVLVTIPAGQLPGAVAGAVVNDDQLEIFVGLRQCGGYRPMQGFFGIIGRHDDADKIAEGSHCAHLHLIFGYYSLIL